MSKAPDFRKREDKLSPYLKSIMADYLFDEFSESYIRENKMDFLKSVPVPFKASDILDTKDGNLAYSKLADNIAMVIGTDTHFKYLGPYMQFLAMFFNEKLISVYTTKGADELIKHGYRKATAYYRAALLLDSTDMMAMFGYACALREWYLSLEGEDDVEELIEILKAESTEYFEWAVIEHPEFAPSYYYLGFAYLNAALYTKAQFIWTRFLEVSKNKESAEYKEIEERLSQLDDPVRIEQGINKLTTGDLEAGLKILEPYVDSRYSNWWPLHYYLACTYRELEQVPEAIEGFKRVLALAPSNLDANQALAEIYEEQGEEELSKKYYKKCEIISKNLADDASDAQGDTEPSHIN